MSIMRAVVIPESGGPEHLPGRLAVTEVPRPEPGEGQVLVRVRAVGVCHRDILDRRGAYPFMKRPVITGHEFAGEVVALGPGTSGLRVGDHVVSMHRPPCGRCRLCQAGDTAVCTQSPWVFGITVDGGYAEYVAAHADALVPLPAGVDFAAASFLYCTAAVALRALRTQGRLQAGETVLITGASGGVGIHAIQVAKLLGARVLAVTTSAAKAATLTEAGADDVLVTSDLGFHHEVQARTGGVDLALELVGVPTFNASLRSLRPGGRLILVGNVTAERVEVNPGWLIVRQVSLGGTASAARRDLEDVLAWAQAGRLRPIIAARLPLTQAQNAQARLEARDVVGRIVLLPETS